MDKSPKEIALETREAAGARLSSPSAARNKDPIRGVFLAHMPKTGTILEIASGTGEHVVHLAAALPNVRFLPGDPDAASRRSIDAWRVHSRLVNIDAPHLIDATEKEWTAGLPSPLDGVFSINMIHIAPFGAAEGLIAGAGTLLRPGGKLFLYGPFARNGVHTAPSNGAFDRSLKARDPSWGVRDLDREIVPLAEKAGLALEAVIAMPANNLSAVFRRQP